MAKMIRSKIALMQDWRQRYATAVQEFTDFNLFCERVRHLVFNDSDDIQLVGHAEACEQATYALFPAAQGRKWVRRKIE